MNAQEMFMERPQYEALLPYELPKGSAQLHVFTREFHYKSSYGHGVIPVGFVTDFASIPSFFKRYIDDDDPRILAPSLRHDHRYTTQEIPRNQADLELALGMRACGARLDQCLAVWIAVRLGGWFYWRKRA